MPGPSRKDPVCHSVPFIGIDRVLPDVLVPAMWASSLCWGSVSFPGSAGLGWPLTHQRLTKQTATGLLGGHGHRPPCSFSGAVRCLFRALRASVL